MAELGALSQGVGHETAYVVIASVRPSGDLDVDDAFRWCSASDIVESHGMTLLEWFVIGAGGIDCPRDLIGEPERWPLRDHASLRASAPRSNAEIPDEGVDQRRRPPPRG